MKKLILTIGICALGLAGFAATDAELKAMLDAKDYAKFVTDANSIQLTNLVSVADAKNVCEAALSTNRGWMATGLCKAKRIDWKTVIDIAIEKQHPATFNLAVQSNNNDLIIDTWEKVLDIPTTSIWAIYKYIIYHTELKINHLELTKKTAEMILSKRPQFYTQFVFGGIPSKISDEYKAWANTCIKNVNEKTCNKAGWNSLMCYNPTLLKSDMYYFESNWKQYKLSKTKNLYLKLRTTPYYTKAVDAMASSVTDPHSALYVAKIIDEFENNKKLTTKLYPVISKDIHLACEAAFYLNDTDKVIDIMLNAGEELTAEQLEKVIPIINSLGADYRTADIVKALRNINARYTLKLYDDRKTWEPILSKIRALIDVRQM